MNWDKYYIEIAKAVAQKSKDNSTKVGVIIVSNKNRIVSTGYNGWIEKCEEKYMKYEPRILKYTLVCHAEMNAILSAQTSLEDSVLYSTLAPCAECLKNCIQAKIRKIFYEELGKIKQEKSINKEAIRIILKATKIPCLNITNNKNFLEEMD